MDEFEQMWNRAHEQEAESQSHIEAETPEYQVRDGIARLKILADMLMNYFHAKYGEPLQAPHQESKEFQFHLK